MGKILVGMICDGKAGGVDKYLLNFYQTANADEHTIDFLTNKIDETLEAKLARNGSKLFEVASLMHPVRQYNEVKKIIQEGKYDTVYMNISTALAFPVLKAAYDCRVKKVIAHSHTSAVDEENFIKRQIFTMLHLVFKHSVCKYSNKFLACSDEAAKWMFNNKIIKHHRYEVIFNAVDTSKFNYDEAKRRQLRDELGIKDEFVVGNVGNMCYQKNQLFLIDVFYELLKKEPSAKLVIIGDGNLMDSIKDKIETYQISKNVKLLGRVDVSKGYMNVFDVFAFPSRFEGLGIVLIEAQCSKVPCVVSEKVPTLAKVSNMLTFLPFNKTKWVETILSYKNCDKDAFYFESMDNLKLSNQEEILKAIIQ